MAVVADYCSLQGDAAWHPQPRGSTVLVGLPMGAWGGGIRPPAPRCPRGILGVRTWWHSRASCPTGGDPDVAEGPGPLRRQLPGDSGAGRHLPLLPRRVGSVLPGVCDHTISCLLTFPRCPSVPEALSTEQLLCLTGIPRKARGTLAFGFAPTSTSAPFLTSLHAESPKYSPLA